MKRQSVIAGFTLLEVMVAITLMMVVFAISIPFFKAQVGAMETQTSLSGAHQHARFGVSTIERELRVAGAGVTSTQAMIVQADPYAITFNVDLAANSLTAAGGFGAVYFDPDLPDHATISLSSQSQIYLPRSTVTYPDSNYYGSVGIASMAETISYWLAADTANPGQGNYALYRRVNALPPEIVASGFVIENGDPPTFRYMTVDSDDRPVEVPPSQLPAYHTAIHGGSEDTGLSALTDSIRLVKVFLRARPQVAATVTAETLTDRTVEATIRLLNAGLLRHSTCGDAPVLGSPVSATLDTHRREVELSWSAAQDEVGGERDVERYVIFRRRTTEHGFLNPYSSIPAGLETYSYRDTELLSGDWVYGIAAQDCGGQYSSVSSSVVITVPEPE